MASQDKKSQIPKLKRAIALVQGNRPGVLELVPLDSEHKHPAWRVVDDHPSRAVLRIVDHNGSEVATVIHIKGDPLEKNADGIWQGDTRRTAVARFIAAAPAMHTALENVLALMTNPNAYEPREVMRNVISALVDAGANREELERCIPPEGGYGIDVDEIN